MKMFRKVVVVLLLLQVGISGVAAAGTDSSGTADTAGATGKAKVLIIGDSVFDAFDHVASARELLEVFLRG